jgi:hypothetical protein
MPKRRGRALAAAALTAAAALVGACGGSPGSASERDALREYLAKVEPIRLGTNRLLDRADPITSAYADGEIGAGQARRRMGALERGMADYAVRIAAVQPVPEAMRAAHAGYAHTWILEDSYLSALTAALPGREFDALPDTQSEQRAAIIAWRTRLQLLADRLGVTLPADIQAAGRGEIAPSPTGD